MDYNFAIFDLDGTLTDSMPVWRKIEQDYVCSLIPKEHITKELIDSFYFMPYFDMLKVATSFSKIEYDTSKALDAVYKPMAKCYKDGSIKPKPYALEFLQFLNDSGVKCAIATATPRELCMPCIKNLRIDKYVEFVLSTDDVGISKHKPDIYLQCMKKLGAKRDNTMIFEDALYCCETLKKSGLRFTVIEDYSQAQDVDKLKMLGEQYIHDYSILIDKR